MEDKDSQDSLRSKLRAAKLSALLGLKTARVFTPVAGIDEPAEPPPGRAGASPPEAESGADDAKKGD